MTENSYFGVCCSNSINFQFSNRSQKKKLRWEIKQGSYVQLFNLPDSVYFFVNVVRGLDVHMEQKVCTQDKINVVLSSVDCFHDYLQDQIPCCSPYGMCCTFVRAALYERFFFKQVNYLALFLIQLFLS